MNGPTLRRALFVVVLAGSSMGCGSSAVASPPAPTAGAPTAPPVSAAPPPTIPATAKPSSWVTTFEEATAAPAGATTIEMKGEAEVPTYAPPAVVVPSGTVVLFLVNIAIAPPSFGPAHDVVIGPVVGGEALATSGPVQAGKSAVFTIENVPPGTYAFWCTVSAGHGPHYKLGQVGTLTVTP